MKRKLILTILMLMVGIALAGCDFFGNTTTTTTTQASDTTTTTTTTTGDTSTTTTTTTTEEPTTTTTTSTTTTTEEPTTTTTTTTVTTTTTTTSGVTTTTTTVTTTTPTTTTTTTSISTTTSTGTTTTTSATTVTTTTTEEAFDRQDLVDLFIEKSGEENPDETMIEAQIDFYMTLFGLSSEQDLYDLMIGLDTIMGGFDMIETLQDAKDWYAQAKALGFDKTIVTNVMVNMLRQQVNDAVDRYDEAYYVNEIAQLNAEILNVQGQMAAYRSTVQDYCANSTQVEATCMAWYDTQILVSDAEQAYRQLADQYSWDTYDDMWDWDTFYNLAWNMDDLMYHTYISMDSFYINLYQEAYDSIWNSLSTEQQAMYQDVMDLYETYDTIYYRDFTPLDHALMSDMDNYGNNLQSMMWNYWQSYQDFTWDLQSLQWQIVEVQDQMQREMEQHQMMLQVQAYFNTEAGLSKIKLLMITIYDMLDYAITNFDQDTFDLMFGLMTGQIQLTPEDLNSDNLVMAAGMAADLIDLLTATIDQDDIDNIASIAKDAAAMYVDTLDMTLLEGAALLLKINAAIDKYLNAAYDAVGEISSFLHSIDATKADSILTFIALMQSGTFNQNQIVIGVATLIDTLIADGSIDMEFVSGILVDLYFDVTTMLDPDPATVAAVKLALDANITRIFELAAEIALYDPSTFLSSEQMDSVAEFMARVEALVMMFDQGFETILDPIRFGYVHQDFVNLIESMNDEYLNPEEIELQIDMFMAMFETEDEQFAYNMLLTIQSMVRALERIDSFTAFQNWFGAVVNLGFSNTAIANYMFNIGTWQLDVAINTPDGEVAYIQSIIDEETQYLNDYIGYSESLINFLNGLTVGMTPEQYDNSWNFWFAKLAYFEAQDHYNQAENEAFWSIDYYTVNEMLTSWDYYQHYLAVEDYVMADQMLMEFHSYYDYLDSYQQMLIDNLIGARDDLWYMDDQLSVAITMMQSDAVYDDFASAVYNNAMDYYNYVGWINYYATDIAYWEMKLADAQKNIAMLQELQTYLNDPENEQLVKDVIVIVLDEVENLVMSADPATFDILFSLLFNRTFKYDDGYYTVTMIDGSDPFAPSNPLEAIDLSPAAVVAYAQDISTVLKALFSTMDETEIAKVKELVFDIMALQLASEGYSETEITDQIAVFDTLFTKYFPILQETIGIVTDALDGLTEEKAEIIINAINKMTDRNYDTFEEVIAVSTAIDALLGDGTLDVQRLVEIALEVYMDMNYGMSYAPEALSALQLAYADQINAIILLAAEIKTFDMATITEAQMATLMEAKKRVEYLFKSFMDPESIDPLMTFGYDHQDFLNLIYQFFGCISEEEAEAKITMFMTVLDTTEESAYYQVMMYGMLLQSAQGINSVEDAQAFLLKVLNSGISKEQMADIAINYLVLMVQERYADYDPMIDYQSMLDQITLFQGMADENQDNMTAIQDEVALNIANLASNPTAQGYAQQLWWAAAQVIDADRAYWAAYYSQSDNWNFQSWLYDELFLYRYGSEYELPNQEAFENLFYSLSWDEQMMYSDVLDLYESYNFAFSFYQTVEANLESMTVYALDGVTLMEVYIHNQRFALMNEMDMYDYNTSMLGYFQSEARRLEQEVRLSVMLQEFISQESNLVLAKSVLVSLLDEVESIATNLNTQTIYDILDLVKYYEMTGEQPTAADVVTILHAAGEITGLLLQTVDQADILNANNLIDLMLGSYLNAFDDNALQTSMFIAIVDNYFADFVGFVPLISGYLSHVDEARVQVIMDQIPILDMVGDQTDLLSNYIRAVAIANIIVAASDDPNLDVNAVLATVLGAALDVQYAMGYLDETNTLDKVAAVTTIVTDILTEAPGISIIDPYNPTATEETQINEFHLNIEALIVLLDSYFNPGV